MCQMLSIAGFHIFWYFKALYLLTVLLYLLVY